MKTALKKISRIAGSRKILGFAGLVLLGSVAACTTVTSGTGVASTPNGQVHATFAWTSTGGHKGTMTAQLDSGESYSGIYFQITHDTDMSDLGPLWVGWGEGPWGGPWGGGPGRGPWGWHRGGYGGGPGFVRSYSGRVVANLEGPNGTHMRCRFDLMRPSSGMPGGGQGSCELPSGQTIDTTFAHA